MQPHGSRTLLFFVITMGGIIAPIPPADASPQPRPICGACGTSFERVAADHGIALTVTRNTARVEVHANGSATWIVTNDVNESAAGRLTDDRELLERIARGAVTDTRGLPHALESGSVRNGRECPPIPPRPA
ncbi:hypothetical protein BRC83_06580 [Halobacteriales archaeon QS_1_68_17]|nr:MAG: hypothetical protein BRC83_06580 [Halobacteriales archaeon QS_1_68_17]